jgi:hypothetical protein
MTQPPLEPAWASLVETIAAMITLAPEYVVVQVHTDDGPNGGPYVQTLVEEDGALTIEASSNTFLDTPIDDGAIEILHSLGWNDPDPEFHLPNFHQFLQAEDVKPGFIADLLVRTLRDGFAVSQKASFEMAPHQLFTEIVNGEYGDKPGMIFFNDSSDPRDPA